MKILFYNGSSNVIKSKISYAVETFFSTYGLEYEIIDSLVGFSPRAEDLVLIYDSYDKYEVTKNRLKDISLIFIVDSFSNYFSASPKKFQIVDLKKKDSDFSLPLFFYYPHSSKNPAYALYDKNGNSSAGIEVDGYSFVLCADILGSCFYLLSLQEELENNQRDKHDRFLAKYSFRKEKGLISVPLVNQYFKLLLSLILSVVERKKTPLVRKLFWPNDSKLAIALTHDVDILDKWYLYLFLLAWRSLKKGRIWQIIMLFYKTLKSVLGGKNPLFSFEKIMEMESKYGYNSSFYFLSRKPSLISVLQSDSNYNLNNEKIKGTLGLLKEKGNEVGLHGSYLSYDNQYMLAEERKNMEESLGGKISGTRQHFLKMDLPKTWQIQKECGFLYDSTLGFADQSGFRAGLAFPFYPYDSSLDKRIDIIELNHNVMDQTYEKYQSKTISEIKAETFKLIEEVEKSGGGLVTLNWHNNMVEEFGFLDFVKLYQEILQYISKNNYFVTSAEKIARWWIARENVRLDRVNPQENKREWEYNVMDAIDNLTFRVYNVNNHKILIQGAEHKVSVEGNSALINFPHLEKGRTLKFILGK